MVTGAGWAPYDPQVLGGQEPLELWVDGQRYRGTRSPVRRPARPTTRTRPRFTATKNGPLRLAVLDVDHSDNTGTLAVTLAR